MLLMLSARGSGGVGTCSTGGVIWNKYELHYELKAPSDNCTK